jgi:hypothetical protein
MSELGMNSRGEVRTAYEFKDIFDESGISHRPYRCPFCEVDYEDRCIVTDCVKAPHFKLPNGTSHRGNCDGEPEASSSERVSRPARVVVGEVDVPAALVTRRAPRIVRGANAKVDDPIPSEVEIQRRRRSLAGEGALAGKFTSSLLRAIVEAHKKLMKVAFETAAAAGHRKGSAEYKDTFKALLEAYPLELFGQKLTYRNAFQTSKLSPASRPRIYEGSGTVDAGGRVVQLSGGNEWPKEYGKPETTSFTVTVRRTLSRDAVAAHEQALDDLLSLAAAGQSVRWWAYGLPRLDAANGWVLAVESLDHLYWEVVR